jgi:hypothetical protein
MDNQITDDSVAKGYLGQMAWHPSKQEGNACSMCFSVT